MSMPRALALLCLGLAADASAATLQVGPGKHYAQPCLALVAAGDGDTVEIDGSGPAYRGDVCVVGASRLTIHGINGRPKIDAGGRDAGGKGIWVISGNDVSIDNVEMVGAKVSDGNGAALRLEGIGFTLRNSFLHDNENGILSGKSPSSRIVLEKNEFGHNGGGTGQTHNVYIGEAGSLTFRYNYSHDADVGHNLKSRAHINTVAYNRFSSTAPGETGSTASGKPSYELDLPNGGTSYVIGNVIQQPAENENGTLLAYAEEGATNPGQELYVVNNTFINDDPRRGTFVLVGKDVRTPVLLQNNIFAGRGSVTNQANAIDKTNYAAMEVGFVDRARGDLHPTENRKIINAGSAPPVLASGASLVPVSQYQHVASFVARPVVGPLDIGAYQVVILVPSTPKPFYQKLLDKLKR
ncbi:MAG TPA: right-handed parallel beta-helix repeat-containing protein [Telluria sp.]|nr:right-handed parallel beta-helix repeat-containing protein [Telluria sp.]